MLCSGCQAVLQLTSSMKGQVTTFYTSLERIQDSSEHDKCFLCSTILKSSRNPESGFHPIYNDALEAEDKGREPRELVLGYSVKIDFRPEQECMHVLDTVLLIHWNFKDSDKTHSNAKLKVFFSPVDQNQPQDKSYIIEMDQIGSSGRISMKPRRRLHSRLCPYCTDLNLSSEEYDQTEDQIEENDDETVETTLRDGFQLDTTIDGRYASDNTGSDETWLRIEQWLNRCGRDHTNCPKRTIESASIPKYPTRLLDLSPLNTVEGDFRLIISEEDNPTGRYMTLSHCWGNHQITTLTSEDVQEFRQKIGFSSLPKTFRDAVVITRKLGVRYLWIDSLCILQSGPGFEEDWHRESAKMNEVFRHSFLNIGATGASDGRDGCFRPRDYFEVFRPIISKPECWAHYENYRQPYRLIEESFLDDMLMHEPLLQRGWVFQERFLAPRMLHFGSKQLFWECNEMRACESYPEHLMPPTMLASLSELKYRKKYGEGETGGALRRQLGYYQWYQIIREYTSKSLTHEEDKLIALSGVAQQYADLELEEDDKYWAGIWERDLPGGLCWTVQGKHAWRPKKWRAPSWSWASIEGVINSPLWGPVHGKFLFKIFRLEVEYALDSNKFGAIKSARIPMQGRIVQVQAMKMGTEDFVLTNNGYEIQKSVWYPDEHSSELVQDVLCLCLATGGEGLYGLTVAKVEEESDEYVRTGVFRILPEDSDTAPSEWICQDSPFAELWDMDLEDEDEELDDFVLV